MATRDVLARSHAPADTFRQSPETRDVDWGTVQTESVSKRTGGKSVYQIAGSVDDTIVLTEYQFRQSAEDISALESALDTWRSMSAHDHVVGLVDWQLDGDLLQVVTEQMDGGTLEETLADSETVRWPDEAVWITECLCTTLEQAHEQGVVHLAIDPATVQFRETPQESWNMPKLGGWGLSQSLRDHPAAVTDWSTAYVAPEQLDPDRFGEPDERTDIYRLGAVLYEMLTGTPPREREGYEALKKALADGTVTPASKESSLVPDALDELLLTALATDPAERFETVTAFREALAELDLAEGLQTGTTVRKFRQLGGGPGNRGCADGFLNDDQQVKERWQTRLQSSVESTPAVAYGTVYVAGLDGTLTALHADTGTQRWQVTLADIADEIQPQRGQEDVFVLRTAPAVGQGYVCVNTTHGVFGFDARDGTKCWERSFTFRGGLTVHGDRVYVPGADELAALAIDSGETVWSTEFDGDAGVNDVADSSFTISDSIELEGEPWDVGRGQDFGNYVGAPAVDEEIVALSTKRAIVAFDAASGDHRWNFPIDSPLPPSIGEGRVYAGDEATLYALDATTGDPQWRADTEYPVAGAPAVGETTVYVTLNDQRGGVAAYDSASGDREWQYSLTEIAEERFPVTNAVVSDHAVFLLVSSVGKRGDDIRELIVLDAETGTQQWRYELGGQAFGPPAVFADRLVVGNDEYAVTTLSTPGDIPTGSRSANRQEKETATPSSQTQRAASPSGTDRSQSSSETDDLPDIDWTQANPFIELLEDTRNNEIHKDKIDDILGWPDGKARSVYKDLKAHGYVKMDDWGYVMLLPESER